MSIIQSQPVYSTSGCWRARWQSQVRAPAIAPGARKQTVHHLSKPCSLRCKASVIKDGGASVGRPLPAKPVHTCVTPDVPTAPPSSPARQCADASGVHEAAISTAIQQGRHQQDTLVMPAHYIHDSGRPLRRPMGKHARPSIHWQARMQKPHGSTEIAAFASERNRASSQRKAGVSGLQPLSPQDLATALSTCSSVQVLQTAVALHSHRMQLLHVCVCLARLLHLTGWDKHVPTSYNRGMPMSRGLAVLQANLQKGRAAGQPRAASHPSPMQQGHQAEQGVQDRQTAALPLPSSLTLHVDVQRDAQLAVSLLQQLLRLSSTMMQPRTSAAGGMAAVSHAAAAGKSGARARASVKAEVLYMLAVVQHLHLAPEPAWVHAVAGAAAEVLPGLNNTGDVVAMLMGLAAPNVHPHVPSEAAEAVQSKLMQPGMLSSMSSASLANALYCVSVLAPDSLQPALATAFAQGIGEHMMQLRPVQMASLIHSIGRFSAWGEGAAAATTAEQQGVSLLHSEDEATAVASAELELAAARAGSPGHDQPLQDGLSNEFSIVLQMQPSPQAGSTQHARGPLAPAVLLSASTPLSALRMLMVRLSTTLRHMQAAIALQNRAQQHGTTQRLASAPPGRPASHSHLVTSAAATPARQGASADVSATGTAALSPEQLSWVVWACARRGMRPPPEWVETFMVCTQPALPQFRPRALAEIWWALCKLRWLPQPAWRGAFMHAAALAAPLMSPQEACMVLWGLGSWRLRPPPSWLTPFMAHVHASLHLYNATSLVVLLTAFANLGCEGYNPPASFSRTLAQALLAVLPNMEPLAVARMGWILARKDPLASLEASQKLAQISQELAPKRHEQAQKQTPAAKQAPAIKRPQGAAPAPVPAPLSVREAVMSAWLNACKVHLQQGVQAPLRGQGQAAGRGFTAEHLAQVLYAVPRLSLRPTPKWFKLWCSASLPLLPSMSPQQLAMVASSLQHPWSSKQLQLQPPQAWTLAFLAACQAKMPLFNAPSLRQLASALASMPFMRPSPTWGAVLLAQADLLSAQTSPSDKRMFIYLKKALEARHAVKISKQGSKQPMPAGAAKPAAISGGKAAASSGGKAAATAAAPRDAKKTGGNHSNPSDSKHVQHADRKPRQVLQGSGRKAGASKAQQAKHSSIQAGAAAPELLSVPAPVAAKHSSSSVPTVSVPFSPRLGLCSLQLDALAYDVVYVSEAGGQGQPSWIHKPHVPAVAASKRVLSH